MPFEFSTMGNDNGHQQRFEETLISKTTALIFLFAVSAALHAEQIPLKLGSTFSDNMVVQRDQDINVWGQANAGASVRIKFGDQSASAVADSGGHWQTTVKPLPVGGPYTAKVSSGNESITLSNFLSGDVFLCAGQSNMQFGVDEDAESKQMLEEASRHPNIRLLWFPKTGSDKPSYLISGQWAMADAALLPHFSAVAFHMGLALCADPNLRNVPIGLIDSSFGGTAAEGWTPPQMLGDLTREQYSQSMFNFAPGSLYNNMIAPLGRLPLSGVVWYQGESNAGKPQFYARIMTSLISAWRGQFGNQNLPFILVQLPPFVDTFGGYSFAWVRDVQSAVVKSIPNTGLVVSIDTTPGFSLHPVTKGGIGRRAALQARRLVYHEDIPADGPTVEKIDRDGNSMRVKFNTHAGRLVLAPGAKKLLGFSLADADGIFHFADAVIESDDTVIITCSDVSDPKYVRYAWGAVPQCNLYNQAGLPAGPFRNDDLPPTPALEIKPTLPLRHVATDLYEATIGGNGELLSLGVDKQQFVSNNLDGFGAANFPSGFGARQLQNAVELTPDSVCYSDSGVAVTYCFSQSSMTLKIHNLAKNAKDKVIYHLRLSSGVRIEIADDASNLKRDKAQIRLTGADPAKSDPFGGGSVEATIDGNSTKILTFSFSKLP